MILIFFLMFPHLKPDSLEYLWPTIDTIFDAGRLLSTAIIIFLFILKKRIPSLPIWLLAVLQGWILFATYVNGGDMRSSFLKLASVLAVALVIDFFSSRPRNLLLGIMTSYEPMLYANLISVLLYYPNGLYISEASRYRCYFLGYHNLFILYALPAIVFAMLYYKATGKKTRSTLLILSAIVPICITWSATTICGLLALVGILFLYKTGFKKWISFYTIFIGTMTANLLISVLRIMDRVLWIANFIESFLRKKITLTGRIYIWDSFYTLFQEAPWIGYGTGVMIYPSVGFRANHAHNQWFQLLFEGGIPALLIFLILNFIVGQRLTKYSKESDINICLAAFASLFVLFIGEAYSNPILYMLYIVAWNIEKIASASALSAHQLHSAKRGHHVPNRKLTEEH